MTLTNKQAATERLQPACLCPGRSARLVENYGSVRIACFARLRSISRWLSTDFPIDVRKRCSLRLIVSTKSSTRFRSGSGVERLAEYAGRSRRPLFPAPESAHAQDAFVTVDFAVSQPYVCLSLVAEGEGIHREGDRDVVFHFHGYDLVVHHVVVAAEHASAVIAVRNCRSMTSSSVAAFRDVEIRNPVAPVIVEVHCRVGALLFQRAVDAPGRASLRGVFGPEPSAGTRTTIVCGSAPR